MSAPGLYPARRWRGVAALILGAVAALAAPAPAYAETVRHDQWHLDALHVPQAQQITRGEGVIVAVVDSVGVDANHPDLAGQVLPGTGIGPGTGTNGWSDAKGANHATGVAGIIAAKGGGPNHALGIAPGARILPVGLAVNSAGQSTTDEVAKGIRWATDHGARVINLSVSAATRDDPDETSAVAYALAHDVVVVAGAGNTEKGQVAVGSPANIPGVVAVSGVGRDGGFWSGSVHGPEVTIGAPAIDIVTTAPPSAYANGYSISHGTSEATAIVSGTAALIRAKYPNLNAANVIQRLIATAKDQPPAGRDEFTGYGTVRVLDALTKPVPEVTANPLGGPTAGAAPATKTGTPAARSNSRLVVFGLIGGAVLVVFAVVIAVVVAATRRPRRPTAPPPGPGYPGQPYPPGWPRR